MWRYQVFAQKLTWYFIGVYIIKCNVKLGRAGFNIGSYKLEAETITKSLVNVNNSYPRSVLDNSLPTLYWQSTSCDKQGECKLVAQQFFEGAVLGVNFNPVPMTGFKKEGMRSCTGENCVAKILGWFSNRAGTSVDDGRARGRTKRDFRCPICRSAIGQASSLICMCCHQPMLPFCC